MASIAFPTHAKILQINPTTTYSYVYNPSVGSKPTLLFIHGFPSSSYDWRHQILHFSSLGYGVLAPDLRGYGQTSSSSDLSTYKGKSIAAEIIAILNYESLPVVHAISHDFGAALLSKIANYYPERLISATFLVVPYNAPGQRFDINIVIMMLTQMLGYETFGYWKFMDRLDSNDLVMQHFDSWFSLLYTADHKLWKENLGPVGGVDAFLTKNTIATPSTYVTAEEKEIHRRIFATGYSAAMNWYHATITNVDAEDEIDANGKSKIDQILSMPTLCVTAEHDSISVPMMAEGVRAFIKPDLLIIKSIASGHWPQLEKKDAINAVLEKWVKSFGV